MRFWKPWLSTLLMMIERWWWSLEIRQIDIKSKGKFTSLMTPHLWRITIRTPAIIEGWANDWYWQHRNREELRGDKLNSLNIQNDQLIFERVSSASAVLTITIYSIESHLKIDHLGNNDNLRDTSIISTLKNGFFNSRHNYFSILPILSK